MNFLFLGLFIFIINALDSVTAFNLLGEWRAIVYGIASSFIIFGLVQAENQGHIIGGHPYIQILGDSSYVLYLIHLPLMSVLCKILVLLNFNHFGYTVTTTSNPKEVLSLLQDDECTIDLVITDHTMPVMTGLELTTKITKIRPELPVILCTGYSDKLNSDAAKDAGACALMMKPVDLQELASSVRSALESPAAS